MDVFTASEATVHNASAAATSPPGEIASAPVGVSGVVFLLPFQLDVLRVPSPAVTPTNLLFNIVSMPGALVRYHSQEQLNGPLVRQLLAATMPASCSEPPPQS